MQDLCLLAASLVARGSVPGWTLGVLPPRLPGLSDLAPSSGWFCQTPQKSVGKATLVSSPDSVGSIDRPEFSPTSIPPNPSKPSGFTPVSLENPQPVVARSIAQPDSVHLKAQQNLAQQNLVQQNLAQQHKPQQKKAQQSKPQLDKAQQSKAQQTNKQQNTVRRVEASHHLSKFSPTLTNAVAVAIRPSPISPTTGGQLYQQRAAALRAGKAYTRLAPDSFSEDWLNTTNQPSYRQWVNLLHQEAAVMARGQGNSRLSVLLGDSLSMWFPSEMLPRDRFWLNQGISGDTTTGVLQRLHALDGTRPDVVHVMVGINDLRRGATDLEIVSNLQQIVRQLKQIHPQTRIIVHSILPTRLASLPTARIRRLNYSIAAATIQEGVFFLNLQPAFSDEASLLRRDFTTDGIHLNAKGYKTWESVLASIQGEPTDDALVASQQVTQ